MQFVVGAQTCLNEVRRAIGATRVSNGHDPWFVARKDMATSALYVVQGHDHPWLLSPALHGDAVGWVAGAAIGAGLSADARAGSARS